jgi:hypothetical protein
MLKFTWTPESPVENWTVDIAIDGLKYGKLLIITDPMIFVRENEVKLSFDDSLLVLKTYQENIQEVGISNIRGIRPTEQQYWTEFSKIFGHLNPENFQKFKHLGIEHYSMKGNFKNSLKEQINLIKILRSSLR